MKIYTKQIDTLDPEVRAMIQAFYSRSTMSIEDRIKVLGDTEEKIKKALKNTYIGYGHESVGEMGYITLFFEGISMLAAKAIQDNPLYCGQESSTRYIDFSKQPIIVPENAENPDLYLELQEKLRAFYVKALPITIENIKLAIPIQEGEKPELYEKTVKARAFDILRGFLPAGASTNVAWTGNFRIVGRHLRKLLVHPLVEVRKLAQETYNKLLEDYPNSFRQLRDTDFEARHRFYTFDGEKCSGFEAHGECNDLSKYDADYYQLIDITSCDVMDFGSYRDLQRHRNNKWIPPILTNKLGFNNFYMDNLPVELLHEAIELIGLFNQEFDERPENIQYLLPMGFNVNILMKFDVEQAIYLARLRSSKTVHPTLRVWAQNLGKFLEKKFNLKNIGVDYETENWTLKRGSQDIVEKSS